MIVAGPPPDQRGTFMRIALAALLVAGMAFRLPGQEYSFVTPECDEQLVSSGP